MKQAFKLGLAFILTVVLCGCTLAPTVLTVSYAFRRAEHDMMTSPQIQAKITDIATQTKINALEGSYDTAWNCMYNAYVKAATGIPEGQAVNVNLSDFSPCAANAWGAAFQIITTVRAFDSNFLNTTVTYNLPGGKNTVAYDPAYFISSTPPALPAAPPSGALAVK